FQLTYRALCVDERAALGDLAAIDRRDEAMRMAGLIVTGDNTASASIEPLPDLAQIAIEQVDAAVVDGEPAAAIDPRTPFADLGDGVGSPAPFELRGNRAKRSNVDRPRAVVQPDVIVGPRVRGPG